MTTLPIPTSEQAFCVWPRNRFDLQIGQPVRPRRVGKKFTRKRGELIRLVLFGFRGQMATVAQVSARSGLTLDEVRNTIARMQMFGKVELVHRETRGMQRIGHYRPVAGKAQEAA